MPKEINIFDAVERGAARHGIPRLQLWQDAAKALIEKSLPIAKVLEPTTPADIESWLFGFRASVDRYNDPHGGGRARILKHIIVREADFERWLRGANKLRRGPRSGATGYRDADRKMFPRISRLIKKGEARSPYGAALMLADQLAGTRKPENRAKRVSARYRKEYGAINR
jgi:hypothetical protein